MSEFQTSDNATQAITVGYWSIRGLGAPLRAMVMYSGVSLNNVMYDLKVKEGGGFDADEWFSVKPALKEINPLINLPYIKDGDVIVSQTNACLVYLGRKLGLWGKTLEEQCDCEQLLCEIMDLRNDMTGFAYKPAVEGGAQKLIGCAQGKNGVLQKLELWLQKKVKNAPEGIASVADSQTSPGAFLVGNSATAPDFHLYEMLVQYEILAKLNDLPPFLANYPCLMFFKLAHEALPGNARYLASLGKLGMLPFNQKMASFGASVTAAPWQDGEKYDFHTLTGIF